MVKEKLRDLLTSREKKRVEKPGGINSAVLVPIYCQDGELHILFTKRTEKVKTHKGHVCFPGGSCEEFDESLELTAIRETEEEIGLPAGDIEIIGELDDVASLTTNYIISPFVGFITYPYDFVLNEFEAERIIEVRISDLLDDAHLHKGTEFMAGESITSYFYHYKGDIIWGATARILSQFLDVYSHATDGYSAANEPDC